ncbi:DUF5391 family protein [Bacillus carboniphilus]|uniref:DUF5391 family protein n=1 Tax=Bacillus carboniphilus TaxID=86663 RepID=A0ABY9JWR1_9BACI|nr:DUF5391 family protein [Bacillus carboniphilus]WLR42065.1 DUF5391 family protein [Bacillus carboniphilus]
MKNSEKVSVMIVTLISAFLFFVVIILASASPLSEMGRNANQFNSLGMWIAIAMIFAFYIIPLSIYIMGVDAMKYVMAIFCGVGVLCSFSILLTVLIVSSITKFVNSSLLGLALVCGLFILNNIFWYFITFRSAIKEKKNLAV